MIFLLCHLQTWGDRIGMANTKKLVCPNRAALNRIPVLRKADRPMCGKCKHGLLPDHPIELDDRSPINCITRREVSILVDFWTPWCGPCKMLAPAFSETARKLSSSASS